MIITRSYKRTYEDLFKRVMRDAPKGRYDENALPSYTHSNRLMSWLFWKRIEMALALAGNLEGKSVLDFGCGGGVTFKHLSEVNCRITGCDDDSYELARAVCDDLQISARLYRDLSEIKNQQFDCIFALDVLEHIDDLDGVIDRLVELSHANTVIVLSGPTETSLYKLGRALAGFSHSFHVRNIYDIEETFRSKQLRNIETKRLYFPFTLFRISSWGRQRVRA